MEVASLCHLLAQRFDTFTADDVCQTCEALALLASKVPPYPPCQGLRWWAWAARGSSCPACTRRLKIRTLLFGEGTCLVRHIYALESRLQTEKNAKYGKSLSHLETSRPWVGRLHAVQKPPLSPCQCP